MTTAPATTGQTRALPDPTSMPPESLWRRIDRTDLARTLFVAACAIALTAGVSGPWPTVPLVAVAGLAVGCWPILAEAWHDIRNRRMSMELSMLLAIVAAAAIGAWTAALAVTVFVLAAEILEDLTVSRGMDALADLMAFLPATVQVRDAGGIRTIRLDEVHTGQTILIAPGGRIPVDGVIAAGASSVDQSRITGESMPVCVTVDERVFAGSINLLGAIEVAADKVGAESSYGQIIDAVRAAQRSRAPVQRLADRLAGYLVYIAIGAAAITFLATRDLTSTISVIMVAGACGIAAGTPLAVLASIGRVARAGAFVKDGTHLEKLATVDTIVFDKTGTLTVGAPRIVAIHPVGRYRDDDVLAVAASAELYSEHPLGRAIVARARSQGLVISEPDSFDYEPGRGLSAHVDGRLVTVGNTDMVTGADRPQPVETAGIAVHVAADGQYLGVIVLADEVRASSRRCIADLHAMGLRIVMLTGDAQETGSAVAAELGIDDVRAQLLPADKLAAIDEQRVAGRTVAMVGDGVNDAPALASADVGIAMGSGTDIARHSADIVLISSDLADLTRTVRVARRARRIVMGNFAGTIAVDAVGIVLAAFGLLGPILAAIVHVGSETAFILNSARLIPRHSRGRGGHVAARS